jgi:amino acid transporter
MTEDPSDQRSADSGDRLKAATSNGFDPAPESPEWCRPRATSGGTSPLLPETRSYRLKRKLLGPPLVSDQLQDQRLGKPVALAVLSSDVMSSAAYASESILRILVPAAGLAAFALVTPVTALLLMVLGVVCLCYRQVVKAYPVSGGSYVVSRENFGYTTAQVPGAALLCSYTLTVAVSIAAGVDAVISAFPALSPYPVELSIAFVLLLAFGNLRGIREAGRVFAVPTYWFLASMAFLVLAGGYRLATEGHLHHLPLRPGHIHVPGSGTGLLLGASLFIFLKGFANGGSAMTGMEAISNAVPVFREPQVRNARTTLVLMATILGALFLSVSAFAALTHAVPFISGTPTVLSEIGHSVFGTGTWGALPYYSLQFSTALILILGANTSFNGFPLLVNFIAEDAYLPRPLTTRGHRLVYSNGVGLLTLLSVALLLATRARVASLIPLYACTVFTGFTMAGAGMTKYHWTRREPGRTRNLLINGIAFVASAIVTLIFVVTEFTSGAWLVVVIVPLLVLGLSRTHKRYVAEKAVLSEGAAAAAVEAPVLRNHIVVVLVDGLDLATARAIRLGRSLATGNQVRVVHFMIDQARAERLTLGWGKLGLDRLPLEVMECPDRRLARAATELADDLACDGQTEVLFVLPRRADRRAASRLLHDRTADRIVAALTRIPNVSATIAPFDVQGLLRQRAEAIALQDSRPPRPGPVAGEESRPAAAKRRPQPALAAAAGGSTPLGEVVHRQRTVVSGRVRTVQVQPWAGISTFECTLVDATGALTIVFLGRRSVPGIKPGTYLTAEGAVGSHRGRLAMLNPAYELQAGSETTRRSSAASGA